MMLPKRAEPNPSIEMPEPRRCTESQLASSSMKLFTTSWNTPSVRQGERQGDHRDERFDERVHQA